MALRWTLSVNMLCRAGNTLAGYSDAHRFITAIGRRMTFSTRDPRETAFLYQRISVAIQRYNAVCLTNTFIYDPS